MGGPFLPLLLLIGIVAFVVGAGVGARVSELALRHRDRRLCEERRVLNWIWRLLREEFGVDKADWMTGFLEQGQRGGK